MKNIPEWLRKTVFIAIVVFVIISFIVTSFPQTYT